MVHKNEDDDMQLVVTTFELRSKKSSKHRVDILGKGPHAGPGLCVLPLQLLDSSFGTLLPCQWNSDIEEVSSFWTGRVIDRPQWGPSMALRFRH